MRPRAHLEQVKSEGLISGWCWDESQPDRGVRLVVLVDGQPVGTTVADIYRPDLQQAGMGDGAHAFSYLLPWDRIASKSVTTIGLIDEASGEALDTTLVFRRSVVLTVEDRLRDVEQQIRLLASRLEETEARARQDAAVMGGVFATIGAFFTRLSELPPEAVPMELGSSITGLLESKRAQLAPFSLARAADPVLTLCVDTRGSLQGLYGCLRAIHLTGLDEAAEIVLIDDGGSDEAALLPALVGNLRYWRLQPGQCLPEARNRAAFPVARDYVAFLSAAARVTPDWLPQMRAAFAARPDCAVIGARLAGPDGGTVVSGLLPDRTGRLADVEDVEADDPVPVAAVIDAAVILRGAVFTELGGFAAGFTEARAAMIDLCLRCWDAGYAVFYQPDCALLWRDEGRLAATAEDPLDPEVAALLAYRWAHSPRAAWPRAAAPILGRALLLDVPEAEATAAALRGLGYDVTRAAEAATDGAYDLVILGTGAAPNAIGARIVVVPDPETEALLSQPAAASKPRVKDALAAVAAADCVIIRTDIAEARLRKLGFGDRLWQLGDWRTLLRHLALPSAAAADRPYE